MASFRKRPSNVDGGGLLLTEDDSWTCHKSEEKERSYSVRYAKFFLDECDDDEDVTCTTCQQEAAYEENQSFYGYGNDSESDYDSDSEVTLTDISNTIYNMWGCAASESRCLKADAVPRSPSTGMEVAMYELAMDICGLDGNNLRSVMQIVSSLEPSTPASESFQFIIDFNRLQPTTMLEIQNYLANCRNNQT